MIALLAIHPHAFLSPDNPLGFGIVDFAELAAALILALIIRPRRLVPVWLERFAARTGWCMLALAVLPVVLRLALLVHCPVPEPSGSDDFSYLLLADTLRHGRLANPPHALPQFFEQIFVLAQPTYSSIYPLGQGLVLALGWIMSGHAWAGVLLSEAALCALCYWMLRGWTSPGWALTGGCLALIEFGPLNYWMNCYWGGAVSAIAGCLVFGALPRLKAQSRIRDAALLGTGLGLQLLTRPFEFVLLAICAVLFFIPKFWRTFSIAGLVIAAAAGLMLFQNRAVTGSWTTLPYLLYRYQYGVPASFTFQPNPVPHERLNREQELDYLAQSAIHGEGTDTIGSYLERLAYRARFYRFFLLAPLYLTLLVFLATVREYRFVWVLLTCFIFAVGTNFYPYFYPHYVAALASLFLLIAVTGLARMRRAGPVLLVCAAQFVFWYALHAWGNPKALASAGRFETWDFINWGDAEGRLFVDNELARAPGKQLIFVRYGPRHGFHEWVHNAANIDASRVVFAHDLGAFENRKLLDYYADRKVWLLEPDQWPPRLSPYR